MSLEDSTTDAAGADDVFGTESTIGVGIGGSCPTCRAPIDLGQEFCLECGSAIRFTARTRKTQRTAPAAGAAAAPAPPTKSGFPWVPFLIVLALIGGGVAFALVGDEERTSGTERSGDSTEADLPTITNEPAESTSETQTTTLEDCIDTGLDGTQPAVDPIPDDGFNELDPAASGSGEEIPQLDDGSATGDDGSGFDEPSAEDTSGATGDPSLDNTGGEVVTVDQNGQLCAEQGSSGSSDPSRSGETDGVDTGGDPSAPLPADQGGGTEPAPSDGGSTQPATDGAWPAGESGWTVIVAGYDTRERAMQSAAELQTKGYTDGGVLFSTDFQSLCPGIHVVFSGTFDSEAEAETRMSELVNDGFAGMYVREVRTDGSRPANCTTVQ